MSYKKWVNAEIDKAKASALSEKLNIDAFVAFLLVSRGIGKIEHVPRLFNNPEIPVLTLRRSETQ